MQIQVLVGTTTIIESPLEYDSYAWQMFRDPDRPIFCSSKSPPVAIDSIKFFEWANTTGDKLRPWQQREELGQQSKKNDVQQTPEEKRDGINSDQAAGKPTAYSKHNRQSADVFEAEGEALRSETDEMTSDSKCRRE